MVSIDPTMPHNTERAFKINELKTEVTNRLAMLEKRVEPNGDKDLFMVTCRSLIHLNVGLHRYNIHLTFRNLQTAGRREDLHPLVSQD
ncbi:hypothetical protein PAMP_004216 [Pampus punctatissimus]